jgi:hypothetical protein
MTGQFKSASEFATLFRRMNSASEKTAANSPRRDIDRADARQVALNRSIFGNAIMNFCSTLSDATL